MTATSNFTAGFSTDSACWKLAVKDAYGNYVTTEHYDGWKYLPVAKFPILDHVIAGMLQWSLSLISCISFPS